MEWEFIIPPSMFFMTRYAWFMTRICSIYIIYMFNNYIREWWYDHLFVPHTFQPKHILALFRNGLYIQVQLIRLVYFQYSLRDCIFTGEAWFCVQLFYSVMSNWNVRKAYWIEVALGWYYVLITWQLRFLNTSLSMTYWYQMYFAVVGINPSTNFG